MSKKKQRLPVKVVMIDGTSKASWDFGHQGSEGWRYVLDMTEGQMAYLPMRVGADIHCIATPNVQWGRS
jgi:hypothetical protein